MDNLSFFFLSILLHAPRLSVYVSVHIPCSETTLYLMTFMTLHSVYFAISCISPRIGCSAQYIPWLFRIQ